LRHLLEDTIKSKDPLIDPDQANRIEEQFQQQNAIIGNFQQENQQLGEMLNQKENETVEWRNLVEEYQRRINKFKPSLKESKKLRKINREKKNEIQKLRQELLLLRSKTSPDVKAKVDEMMKKQEDLAGKVGNTKVKMNALKKERNKLSDQRKELLEKFEQLENEKEQLTQELEEENNLKRKFEELYSEEREKNLALREHLDKISQDDKKPIPRNQSARPRSASKYGRKNDSNNATKTEEQKANLGTQDDFGSNASDEKEILINKVDFSEVKAIAQKLRKALESKNISYHNIGSIFDDDILTLVEVKDILKAKFKFSDNEAVLASRFIFEDDDDEESKVLFDEDKQLRLDDVISKIQSFV
jgi:chromosome segregation ATPase